MIYNNHIVQEDLHAIEQCDFVQWERLRGKTVLVNGATGMIALYVIYTLLHLNRTRKLGVRIIAQARSASKAQACFAEFVAAGEMTVICSDVCQMIEIEGRLDYILHLAGGASPTAIKNDPVGIINANTQGLTNALWLARIKEAHLLYASTREVYGQMPAGVSVIDEQDMGVLPTLEPRSCYPMSKRMGEAICKSYEVQYNVPFTVLRIAHSYGPTMNLQGDGRIMADVLSSALAGADIVLHSSGEAKRSFIYITDTLTGLFCALLGGGAAEAYNLANESEEISVKELAEMVAKKCDVEVCYRVASHEEKSGYVSFERVALSTKKLESLGWNASVTIEQGVQRTLDSRRV